MHQPPEKRLYRNNRTKVFFGVCQGIGEYMGTDPFIIRLVAVIALFASAGTALLVYLLMAVLMPTKTQLIKEGKIIDDGF
ncbi:MAG: PspC domain-containing protein [Bacillota bacterium]